MIDLSPQKGRCPQLCAKVYSECHKFELMVLPLSSLNKYSSSFPLKEARREIHEPPLSSKLGGRQDHGLSTTVLE